MKKAIFLFSLIFLSFFGVGELLVRNWSLSKNYFYEGAEKTFAERIPVRAIFVGTSRVASAIDPETFKKTFYKEFSQEGIALNLGRGNSLLSMHYHGLRNLIQKFPNEMKKTTIFIEAPGGIPRLRSIDDIWYSYPVYLPLSSVLNLSDLKSFWGSQMNLEEKLLMTFMVGLKWSRLISFRTRIRGGILSKGQKLLKSLLGGMGTNSSKLSERGGVRIDSAGVNEVRKAVKAGKTNSEKPFVVKIWEKTFLYKILKMARENQVKVVIYDMPISSFESQYFRHSIRLKNERGFQNLVRQFKVPYLKTDLVLTDQDFPDLMHMSISKGTHFTAALVRLWRSL